MLNDPKFRCYLEDIQDELEMIKGYAHDQSQGKKVNRTQLENSMLILQLRIGNIKNWFDRVLPASLRELKIKRCYHRLKKYKENNRWKFYRQAYQHLKKSEKNLKPGAKIEKTTVR
jgi:hypothetical protein